MIKRPLFLFLLTIFAGFSLHAQQSANLNISGKSAKILFLNFHITKDTGSNKEIISLVEQKIISGNLKRNKLKVNTAAKENDWIIEVLDSSGEIVYTEVLSNPLLTEFEVPSENGSIESQSVSKPDADFSIRFPYDVSLSQIIFRKYSSVVANQGIQKFTLTPGN